MSSIPTIASASPTYRHRLLAPADGQEVGHNAHMLGIEVTEPCLAVRCGLGNIDPQHRPDGGSRAAIEAALTWVLPPPDATLATIRPDADAAGAMAVLGLRAEGRILTHAALNRIAVIARHDRFDRGAWPGMRPLPPTLRDIAAEFSAHGCSGLIAALGARRHDLDACVTIARRWILTGRPGSRVAAHAAARRLLRALEEASTTIEIANGRRIAVATGTVPGALMLAYRAAPVVVAIEPGPLGGARRMVAAQWCEGHVDLRRALAMLAAREPGWGGSPVIIGSPQGRSCTTSRTEMLAILHECGA